jgi:hypothetical protein
MTQTAVPVQRAYAQLLDLARGDAYGSQPQLYAFTWLAAARMVTKGSTDVESVEALAEVASWKQLADAGFPSEAIERVGALRSQDIARRAHAASVVADLHRVLGDTQWDVLPFAVDTAGRRSFGVEFAVLPQLATYLLDVMGKPDDTGELWIPFDGLGQLAIEALRRGWTVRTASPLGMTQLPLELLLIIESGQVEHPRVLRGVERSASGTPLNKSSHVLAIAPFGMPTRGSRLADWDTTGALKQFAKSDSWTVYEFVSRATTRAAFVVPPGILFSGQEERLREYLVHRGGEHNEVEAVIGLPTGFLAAAPSLGGAVLIVTPGRGHDTIQMVDLGSGRRSASDAAEILGQEHEHLLRGTASAARTVAVTRDEVAANEYSLAPSRYLRRVADLGATWKLGDLCEAVRPPTPTKEETGSTAFEVGVGDLNTWRPLESRGEKVVHMRGEPKPGTLLRPGDLVVSIKGTVGKAVIVGSVANAERLVPSQSCIALRIPEKRPATPLSPEYLLMYLRSPHGQAQLESLQVGTGVQHISPNTLLAASVPLPTHDEYVQVCDDFAELCRLEDQRARLDGQMVDIRHRRWTLEDFH